MTTKRSREEIGAMIEALQGELDALDKDPVQAMIDDAIRLNHERAKGPNPLRPVRRNPLTGEAA
jgi:hypothetical protein